MLAVHANAGVSEDASLIDTSSQHWYGSLRSTLVVYACRPLADTAMTVWPKWRGQLTS
jgi:hypothetical protein